MKESQLGTAIAIMGGDSGAQVLTLDDERITEDSITRVTESNDVRVVENSP